MKYRAEIDGLRALAVVPVILFHAGFELFSGGYVGVDVFFVISGYLITTILIDDIENNRFSLVNFYERRARRILPALFFVMLVCIPFAWMWMVPSQMKDFSQSLVAVSLFGSNVLFWRESGYFDAAAEDKPLLHTWSLAVEEQYYVVFPIFLFLAWRYGKNRVFWMIVVMASVSLLLSEWGWRNKASANFYLAPTRAWELLAGSIAAFVVQKRGVQKSDALSLLGLAAIVFSIFAYDETTPFPSVYALVPVLGVVLLVLFADKETLAARLLSTKAFVGIGLISYSAYLWHQPLFSFARIQGLHSSYIFLGLSCLSLLLAIGSWRYIEFPFRNRSLIARHVVFSLSFFVMLAFILIGYLGHKSGGFKFRLSDKQIEIIDYFENEIPEWRYFERIGIPDKYWDACNYYDIEAYRAGKPTQVPRDTISEDCTSITEDKSELFIWGDSHAQQYGYGLKNVLGESFGVRQVASSGCKPSIVLESSEANFCQKSNYEALKHIISAKPDIVLLAQARNHDVDNYEDLIRNLHDYGVSSIVLMGPTPQWNIDLPELLVRRVPAIPRKLTNNRSSQNIVTNKILKKHFSSDKRVIFFDVIAQLCDESGCLIYFGDDVKSGITTWDYGHLTPIASEYIAEKLVPILLN